MIDWIMRSHKVSFRHACELLAKQQEYMGRSDLAKWWLATLLTFGCMVGVGVLVVPSGEGYL